MDEWDLLWTKSTFAIHAARLLRPGQQVGLSAEDMGLCAVGQRTDCLCIVEVNF